MGKIKTCPTCAETFKATRKDQRFCSTLHRVYFNQNKIPKAVQTKATELRDARAKKQRRAKAKRDAKRAHRQAHQTLTDKARDLYLEAFKQGWDVQIEAETFKDGKAEMIRLRDEGIEKIKTTASVPLKYQKMVEG